MDFLSQLQSEIIQALKGKEEVKLQTLRLLSTALHNEKISKGEDLNEADIQTIIKKEVKKRKEAYDSFSAAGRDEAAQKENQEMEILKAYLPEEMSEADVEKIVDEEIKNNPDAGVGQLIGMVIKRTAGQASGDVVAKLVNQKLAK